MRPLGCGEPFARGILGGCNRLLPDYLFALGGVHADLFDRLGALRAKFLKLASQPRLFRLGDGPGLLRLCDPDLRRLVRAADSLLLDQRLADGCVFLRLFEFGLRLCFGLRPLTGMLLAQTPGLLGQALARPRLDVAADLFEVILGDRWSQ